MQRVLGYEREDQQQTLWCWVAVACSVAAFRGNDGWTQCKLAGTVLGLHGCCVSPQGCNETGSLAEALDATGTLAEHQPGLVDVGVIQQQINQGLPVCIRVQRFDGTAHVMAIIGYDGAGESCRIFIEDPWSGRDDVAFGVLRHGEYSYGRWSDTYFTT
jgi:hypothetical protein